MKRAAAENKSKLSSLGDKAVRLIEGILRDMDEDLKLEADKRKYTLTDRCKVLDRAAKFEAIRARIDDDEGDFFGKGQQDES